MHFRRLAESACRYLRIIWNINLKLESHHLLSNKYLLVKQAWQEGQEMITREMKNPLKETYFYFSPFLQWKNAISAPEKSRVAEPVCLFVKKIYNVAIQRNSGTFVKEKQIVLISSSTTITNQVAMALFVERHPSK